VVSRGRGEDLDVHHARRAGLRRRLAYDQ
jgi:hypothetical protein